MPDTPKETNSVSGEVTEKSLIKWKLIQMAAILPMVLSVVFLLKFRGSMLGVLVFFLILIVGVILPQVYRDFIQSHLALKKEITSLQKQISDLSSRKLD